MYTPVHLSLALLWGALTFSGSSPGTSARPAAPATPLVQTPGEEATVTLRFEPSAPWGYDAALQARTDAGERTARLDGPAAGRQTFVVTSADSHGAGTLRDAITRANTTPGPDRITFAPALAGQEFVGGYVITDDLVIDADGMGIIVKGPGYVSVFQIGEDDLLPTVELRGLTIRDGYRWAGSGAGVMNHGTLTLTRCIVRDNVIRSEGAGAGVMNHGTLTLVESAVTHNRMIPGDYMISYGAVGITNSFGTLTIRRSTVSENFTTGDFWIEPGRGVAIHNQGGTVTIEESTISWNRMQRDLRRAAIGTLSGGTTTLRRTTVTRNDAGIEGAAVIEHSIVAGNIYWDCSGVSSNGYNAVGTDYCPSDGPGDVVVPEEQVFTRMLEPDLADNGGPTLTHALRYRPDNPALDLGGTCNPVDQRDTPAPLAGPVATAACDAGAVEADDPALAVALTPNGAPVLVPDSGGSFSFEAALTNTGTVPHTLQAWARATLPDGTTTGTLFGPVTVTLQPGQRVMRTLTQQVPASAPAGSYTYVIYVGTHADRPVDGAGFTFRKVWAADRVADAAGGALPATEGWATATQAPAKLPASLALYGAQPNPFTARTVLEYDLPVTSHVRLVVYDVIGREVMVLVDEEQEAGRHEAVLAGPRLPSGVFLVRMDAGNLVRTRQVTLVR